MIDFKEPTFYQMDFKDGFAIGFASGVIASVGSVFLFVLIDWALSLV